VTPGPAAFFSRSEIEAVSAKAARGAGFDWGLAEEAGMAARRLCEAGMPGPEVLLAYLESERGCAPRLKGGDWRAPGHELLCPLRCGAALSDFAVALGAADIALYRLSYPALILPFAAQAAARLKRDFRIAWTDAEVVASAGRLHSILGDALEAPQAALVTIGPASQAAPVSAAPQPGRRISLGVWRRLEILALATTVPATGSSRAGAGAGNLDND
jgi:Protein of unknown function (DUF3726)